MLAAMNCQYFFMGSPAVDLLVRLVRCKSHSCDALKRRRAAWSKRTSTPASYSRTYSGAGNSPLCPTAEPLRSLCASAVKTTHRQVAESAEEEPTAGPWTSHLA